MKYFKILTFIAFSILLLSSCEENNPQKATTIKISQENTIKKTYKLKGFKQSCCTAIVEYSLKEVDGYVKSKPNVQNQELTVWFKKNTLIKEKIEKAINKTPYKIID